MVFRTLIVISSGLFCQHHSLRWFMLGRHFLMGSNSVGKQMAIRWHHLLFSMNTNQLAEGLRQLQELSEGDYHQPLETVLSDPNEKKAFERIGRLIGVSLKQPFATPRPIRSLEDSRTRSHRGWELQVDSFQRSGIQHTWQYQTLDAIRREAGFDSVEQLARDAHYERGFFSYLARSAHKYICGDPAIRKEIEKHVKAAKRAGFSTKHLTPEVLVQAGGLGLGAYLVAHIPVFGFVGAPVVAGFVLVLYSIGSDAFCKYIDDRFDSDDRTA